MAQERLQRFDYVCYRCDSAVCKNAAKQNNERCLTTSSLSSRTQKPNTENQTARGSQCAKSQRSFFIPKIKKGSQSQRQNRKPLNSFAPKRERAKAQLAQEQLQDIECTIPQPTTPLDCQKADRQKPQGPPNKFSKSLAALQ